MQGHVMVEAEECPKEGTCFNKYYPGNSKSSKSFKAADSLQMPKCSHVPPLHLIYNGRDIREDILRRLYAQQPIKRGLSIFFLRARRRLSSFSGKL
ncbi:hypothetical protein ECG_01885 [Echinococcus granulosus]|uniref:Uncharacterized protein n=1 Tax=Echinococcus granulosus TaxID=6210 RepID=A0A068WBV8_ECHGR|nr:hypothetical protein ECG_01885 [Echinococcus granulosus]CDS15156.1 hypothetical protein EgrG_000755600 [Echinococcus granulosus]